VPAGVGRQENFLLKALPLSLLGKWGARRIREMVFGPAMGEPPAALLPYIELMAAMGRTIQPRVVTIPLLSDAALNALAMPMLVIAGGRDVLIDSAATRRRLARSAPHAEVRFLPEARHYIPGQATKYFAVFAGRKSSGGKKLRVAYGWQNPREKASMPQG
jgi:pimeloyl-ACP methyl ester carboxylesterase